MNLDHGRWETLKRLYETATTLPPEQRDSYIDEHSPDESVSAELRSLLAFHTKSTEFLERVFDDSLPGQVGRYQIVRQIGRGGTSRVYLAERSDGQFRKQVAVKLLTGGLFGEDVRRRFQREQQLLATFDHPNIVRLLDGGVMPDGTPYLIADYVDGVPITRHSADRKARLLAFADLCNAVAYAHERGVVHRDLKPSNVLVTQSGIVKLLDFGIAKLLAAEQSGDVTQTRQWIGTPAYCSPEQARCEPITAASDIYSLGLILYELLLNKVAQPVDTDPLHTASRRICEETPDTSELSRRAERVVRRCLEKNPAERWQSAGALEEAVRALAGSVEGLRSRSLTSRLWKGMAAAVVFAGLLAGGIWYARRSPSLDLRLVPIATGAGREMDPTISPDGSQIAYVSYEFGSYQIAVHDRSNGTRRVLFKSEEGRRLSTPKWSPNGHNVAFRYRSAKGTQEIWIIPASGGTPVQFGRSEGTALAWSPASDFLAISDRSSTSEPLSIYFAYLDSGQRTRITTPPAGTWGDVDCAVSRDGNYVAVARYQERGDGDVWLFSVDGRVSRRLTSVRYWIGGLEFSNDGREVVFDTTIGGTMGVYRVDIEAKNAPKLVPVPRLRSPRLARLSIRKDGGPAVMALEDRVWQTRLWQATLRDGKTENHRFRSALEFGYENPMHSPDGNTLASFGNTPRRLVLLSRDTHEPKDVSRREFLDGRDLVWAPDGVHVAFTASDGKLPVVWIANVRDGRFWRLTNETRAEGRPTWSQDGKSIYFRSDRDGVNRFYRTSWPAIGEFTAVTPAATDGMEAPDGKTFLYVENDQLAPVMQDGKPVSGMPPVRSGRWLAKHDGVYFLSELDTSDTSLLQRYGWSDRKLSRVGVLPVSASNLHSFTFAPQTGEAVWAQIEVGQDIWAVEGFR